MAQHGPSLFVVADSMEGGLGAAAQSHCRAFADKGWTVTLAAPWATQRTLPGVDLVDLPVPEGAVHVRAMGQAARRARRLVKDLAPDVVHVHGLRSLAVLLAAGQRPFVTLHSSGRMPGPVSPWTWARERFRDLTPCLVPAAFSVAPQPRGNWTTVLIPSPLLPALTRVVDEPMAPEPLFAFVARLARPKQPELFVEAMAELAKHVPNARGVVLGDGPDRPAVERRIRNTGTPVTVVGHVDEMAEWYRKAWGVCLFSRSEGLPFVVQEAMWAGRPVVASPLRGIVWFAGDSASYASTPEDVASALLELCDAERCRSRGAEAAARARMMLADDSVFRTLAEAYGFDGSSPAAASR